MQASTLVAAGIVTEDRDGAVLVRVHVQPRASRIGLAGVHGDSLKLRITAPPVDGKANGQIIDLLADLLQVPKSAVCLVSGQQGRQKRLRVTGLSLAQVAAALAGPAGDG